MQEIEKTDEQLYALILNPIDAPSDIRVSVAYSDSVDKLKAFVESERVPVYEEKFNHPTLNKEWTYFKSFRKGGPLERYNVPDDSSYIPFPTLPAALKQEEVRYNHWLSRLLKID